MPVAALVDRLIDPDGDTISFRRVIGATHGSASYNLATGMITFIPVAGFAGAASITYEVLSGGVATQGLLTVNVDAANAGRFDREIQARMANGATLDLSLATLSGPGLDVVTPGARVESLGTPAVGTLTVQSDGSLRYVAPSSFTGHVVLTYRLSIMPDLAQRVRYPFWCRPTPPGGHCPNCIDARRHARGVHHRVPARQCQRR